MKDQPFSNREITTMFDSIERKLDEHADVHTQILTEVKSIKTTITDLERWRERTKVAAYVAGFFITIFIIPLITWAVLEVNTLDEKIAEALADNFTIEPYVESHQ